MKNLVILLTLMLNTGALTAGEIALTFDDAPTPGRDFMSGKEKTDKIIKGLKSEGVDDALFFITTQYINNDSIKRINRYTKQGFHIANHSHAHISAKKNTPNDFLLDFYQSHLLTKDLNNLLKLHRFPYLHYGKTPEDREYIYSALKELGYEIGYVTVDNFDWYLNGQLVEALKKDQKVNYKNLSKLYVDVLWENIQFYDTLAKANLGRSPKHVLLLHENEMAALFIDDLVKHIKSKGWKIISPQEAYSDPISKQYNSSMSFNKQGRIAAIAHSKGVDKALLRHKNENTAYLDGKIKEYKVFE